MKKISLLLLCALLMQLSACNAKGVYELTQDQQQRRCDRMPEGSEREDCLAEIGPDYHQYEKQRKSLEKQND